MKTLIAISLLFLCASNAAAQDCDIPPEFPNRVEVTEGTLWIGFASDKAVYAMTDTAYFYLVVKNIGSEPYYVNWGLDPVNALHVLPAGCTEISEPDCTICDNIYHWPWIIIYYSEGVYLAPGECRHFPGSVAWNWWPIQYHAPVPEPGVYRVAGGLYKPYAPSVGSENPCGEMIAPTTGAIITVTLSDEVSAEGKSWGSIKSLFR